MRGFLVALACAIVVCVPYAHAGGRDAGSAKPRVLGVEEISRAISAPTTGLRRDVLDLALKAYYCGRDRGFIEKPLLTIIDYSLPSTQKRLWVIDLERPRLLFNELVAHGKQSGEMSADSFSNALGSHKSSLGLFRTADTYRGRHGYSLNLDGLEPGINDRAYDRRIVVHGASYVAPEFVSKYGRLGRSLGCPALDYRVSHRVIDQIKGGGALFSFYPDNTWLSRSAFLRCDATVDAGPPRRYAATRSR
jgi:hypothetical protein